MNGDSLIFVEAEWVGYTAPLLMIGYVMFSLTLWHMAERREIKNRFFAWLPVLNLWVLGSLCDQYRYVVHGRITHSRQILPLWAAGVGVLCLLALAEPTGFLGALWATVLDASAAVFLVLLYLCLYRVYTSCDPKRAIGYLIWSACVVLLVPVFLRINMDKEFGMPCRRDCFVTEPAAGTDMNSGACITDPAPAEGGEYADV